MVQAVNRMFAEFKLVFSTQYLKAFPDDSATQLARQLWFSYLKDYRPETILEAAHRAIRESDFLPTVHSILKHCDAIEHSTLPEAWLAYQEACQAGEPKAAVAWSHPVVYHAGEQVGWYFLATTASERAFPVFQRCYRQLCERARQGERFTLPAVEALPKPVHTALPKAEGLQRLRATRALLDPDAQS